MGMVSSRQKALALSREKIEEDETDFWYLEGEKCPLREVLDRVGDKWSVLAIVSLKDGRMRFSDLRRTIEGISQRMLTHTLRQLERDGLVNRFVYPEVPVRVEYELTVVGETLIEPLSALARWSENHRGTILAARAAYDAREGGV